MNTLVQKCLDEVEEKYIEIQIEEEQVCHKMFEHITLCLAVVFGIIMGHFGFVLVKSFLE